MFTFLRENLSVMDSRNFLVEWLRSKEAASTWNGAGTLAQNSCSASEKKSFAILIWRIIFFTCKKHRLLVMITEKHMFSSKPAKKSSPLLWSRDKAGLLQHKYVTYEIVYYFIGGYIINRKLQGCFETWNSWKIFHSSLRSLVRHFSTREEKNFVSLTDHVISSLYSRVHANASLIPYWKMKETVFLYS